MFLNELLFFTHIIIVVSLVIVSLRIGKNTLISLVVLQAVIANLFVTKQISLFGFSVTCSDVFAVGGILALNLLQEHYGKKEASKALIASFVGLLFFMVMSQFHLAYQPIAEDTTHGAFTQVLSNTTRISLSSMAVYFIVQKIDLRLFAFLKKVFNGRYLPFRVALSLAITQGLDTLLFTYVGLYGIVSSVFDVIVLSFCVKLIIISCSSLLIGFSKRILKHAAV